ncbi:MAG: NAD(P)H-dependent oxidoreductase [Acutalibacteraceae bacterium]|nr:NAD(P)H-dependent oxidoreductase [Acutalibacteraceae bacterium]
MWADITIWSFPLYYFGVPGKLKNLIDRQLPMSLPFMENRNDGIGNGSHLSRYNMSGKKLLLYLLVDFIQHKVITTVFYLCLIICVVKAITPQFYVVKESFSE